MLDEMIAKMQAKVKDLRKTAEKSSKEISKACEKKPFFKNIKNFLNSNDPVIFEFRRKIFHLVGGIIPPILALIFPTRFLMWIALPSAIVFIILDWNDLLKYLFKLPCGSFFKGILREEEIKKGELCGLSWALIGFVLILLIAGNNKWLMSIALAVWIFCDAMAALVGKTKGKHKIVGQKTMEGVLAFFFTGMFIIFVYKVISPVAYIDIYFLIIALMFATIVELYAKNINIDDNLAIPVGFCAVYQALCIL